MSYTHLTPQERFFIEVLHDSGFGFREIGRRLGRNHGTISREIRRNANKHGCYDSLDAQQSASRRRSLAQHYSRQMCQPLVDYVADKLNQDWSPEQISGRLLRDFPRDDQMRCSPETIYRWVYIDARQGGSCFRRLRCGHRRRRPQTRYGQGRRFLPGRVSITERPELVRNRTRFGDWEADLMLGSIGKGALMTCLERKSRLLLAAPVPNKSAAAFNAAIEAVMTKVPPSLRHTLTVDNGKEMARFKELEEVTGFHVYFADPYAAWQRGGNENCNGLLRQYFPKGYNFRRASKNMINEAVQGLNHRPRKCLNYQTPQEVFMSALNGALVN